MYCMYYNDNYLPGSYTNQYLDCVENVVESYCGPTAATWQRTLDMKYYQPTMDAIGCTLSQYRSFQSSKHYGLQQ